MTRLNYCPNGVLSLGQHFIGVPEITPVFSLKSRPSGSGELMTTIIRIVIITITYLKFPSVLLTLSWYEICALSFDSMR